MTDKADWLTRVIERALDVVFAKYPARTGLGVVFGGVLSFLARVFQPSLRNMEAINISDAPLWGWLAIGILVMHAPTIIALFKQKPIGNDIVDQALDLIERGNFTQAEKRQQYRNLITQVSSSIALRAETQKDVTAVEHALQKTDRN